MNILVKKGTKVNFTGCIEDQQNWGGPYASHTLIGMAGIYTKLQSIDD